MLWTCALGKSSMCVSMFVLQQLLVLVRIINHSYKGAYTGCCCLLLVAAACCCLLANYLLLACCLLAACWLLLACCWLLAAASLLLLPCCCFLAAACWLLLACLLLGCLLLLLLLLLLHANRICCQEFVCIDLCPSKSSPCAMLRLLPTKSPIRWNRLCHCDSSSLMWLSTTWCDLSVSPLWHGDDVTFPTWCDLSTVRVPTSTWITISYT